MTWLNPLAFVGLLALAVPILVHLFGRRVARRQRFPSLRLLQLAASTPTTSTQPSDLVLLLVRCGMIASAALALAQPLWSTPGRAATATTPARVIVVDTSASMSRLTSDGRAARNRAREIGQAVLDSSREGMVVETSRPGANMSAAASWLDQRSGLRELVVISDFQRGALSDGDLASVRDGIGVRFSRLSGDLRPVVGSADSAVVVTFDADGEHVAATWQRPRADSPTPGLTVLADTSQQAEVRASMAAVQQLVAEPYSSHSIAVVFPGYAGASDLAAQLQAFNQAWQGELLLALRRDDLFSANTHGSTGRSCEHPGASPLRNANGTAVASVGAGRIQSPFEIIVFSCAEPGTFAGTALLAAVTSAASQVQSFPELDPRTLPDEKLRTWERPATEFAPEGRDVTSPDGRWLWLLALLLLVVEEWLRRRARRHTAGTVPMETQQRVA